MSEHALYKLMRKHLRPEGFSFQRVENVVGPGTPDVFFLHERSGASGWIETKHERRERGDTDELRSRELRSHQARWLMEWNEASTFVFVRYAHPRFTYLLVKGSWAWDLMTGELVPPPPGVLAESLAVHVIAAPKFPTKLIAAALKKGFGE